MRYSFPSLYGSLRWTRSAFEVRDAGSKFYGGDARFTYSIKPLGAKVRPTHRFDTTLTDVDLTRFTDFEQFRGVRLRAGARVDAERCSSGRPDISPSIAARAICSSRLRPVSPS